MRSMKPLWSPSLPVWPPVLPSPPSFPRTRTEDRLLKPVTNRARETAQSAFQAAKDAGRERLDELGLTKDRGSDAIRSIIDGARDAAKASAQAAVGTYRKGE